MNEMNKEHLFDIVAALMAGATQKDSKSDFLSPHGGLKQWISQRMIQEPGINGSSK
jgi:hypothetical protein